jgi:hypothetical protein
MTSRITVGLGFFMGAGWGKAPGARVNWVMTDPYEIGLILGGGGVERKPLPFSSA